MILTQTNIKHVETLTHQGNVVVIYVDDIGDFYYTILDLQNADSNDDQSWTSPAILPNTQAVEGVKVRPFGMSLIQVDEPIAGGVALVPFKVLSDQKYIYLFRQSSKNQLYVDRFLLVEAVEEEDSDTLNQNKVLVRKWEVRFKYSGLKDVPFNKKDFQDYVGPDDEPFLEPTIEITYLNNIQYGRFDVILTPTDVPNQLCWHIFAINRDENNKDSIEIFSVRQDDEGLFDLLNSQLQKFSIMKSATQCSFLPGLSAIYFQEQEEVAISDSEKTYLKSSPHVLVAATLGNPSSPSAGAIMVLDFELGRDGSLAKMGNFVSLADFGQGDAFPSVASGLRGGFLNFASSDCAPQLFSSADGLVRLYFKKADDNIFSVLQYRAVTTRTELTAPWLEIMDGNQPLDSTNDLDINVVSQKKLVSFFSRKPGVKSSTISFDKNDASLTVAFLTQAKIIPDNASRTSRSRSTFETWSNLPRDIAFLIPILNGQASSDTMAVEVLKGQQPFYDYNGAVNGFFKETTQGGVGFFSHFIGTGDSPSNQVTLTTVNNQLSKLSFLVSVSNNLTGSDNWKIFLKEEWDLSNLQNLSSLQASDWIKIVNGTSKQSYSLSQRTDITISLIGSGSVDGSDSFSVYIYSARTGGGRLWFIANPNVSAASDYCLDKCLITLEDNPSDSTRSILTIKIPHVQVSSTPSTPPTPPTPQLSPLMGTWDLSKDPREFWNDFNNSALNPLNSGDREEILKYIAVISQGIVTSLTSFDLDTHLDAKFGSTLFLGVDYHSQGQITTSSIIGPLVQKRTNSPTTIPPIDSDDIEELQQSRYFAAIANSLPQAGYAAWIGIKTSSGNWQQSIETTAVGKTNPEAWVPAVQGKAIKFKTSDNVNYLSQDLSGLEDLTGYMSMEAWVKINFDQAAANATRQILYANNGANGNSYGLSVEKVTDSGGTSTLNIYAQSNINQATASIPMPDLNSWHHIAATFDSGFALDLSPEGAEKVYVEASSQLGTQFDDQITVECAIYLKEDITSDAVILSQWGKKDETQSWRMYLSRENNQNIGKFTVIDEDGHPYTISSETAIPKNQWVHLAASYNGKANTHWSRNFEDHAYVELPAVDYPIDFPGDSATTATATLKPFTVEIVFSPTALMDSGQSLIAINKRKLNNGKWPDGRDMFVVRQRTGNIMIDIESERFVAATATLGLQQLSIVVVPNQVDNSTTLSIYRNGLKIRDDFTMQGVLFSVTKKEQLYPWTIGCQYDLDNRIDFFQGSILDFRLWDGVRTELEIGENLFQPLKGREENLVSYVNFRDPTGVKDLCKIDQESSQPKVYGTLKMEEIGIPLEQKFYINGHLVNKQLVKEGAIQEATAPILLGKQVTGNSLNAIVDEARIWSTARSDWAIHYYRKNTDDIHYATTQYIGDPYFALAPGSSSPWKPDDASSTKIVQKYFVEDHDFPGFPAVKVIDCNRTVNLTSSSLTQSSIAIPLQASYIGLLLWPHLENDWRTTSNYLDSVTVKLTLNGKDSDELTIDSQNALFPTWSFFFIDQEWRAATDIKISFNRSGAFANRQCWILGVQLFDDNYQAILPEAAVWHDLPLKTEGLVLYWQFNEGAGKTAFDRDGVSHGTIKNLSNNKMTKVDDKLLWIVDRDHAYWKIFHNGELLDTHQSQNEVQQYPKQFTLGAKYNDTTYINKNGDLTIDELRIWSSKRTDEEISDNVFRELLLPEEHLAAYWQFNETDSSNSSQIPDLSGNNYAITLPTASSNWLVSSNAPLSNEAPEVKIALPANLESTGFEQAISQTPAVVEYGDLQTDEDNQMFGVLKRAYIYLNSNNNLVLRTGIKVDDLETTYLGMVQTKPTLVGYIEGAPPVPSENLTRPLWDSPYADEYLRYYDSSNVQLTEIQGIAYNYSGQLTEGNLSQISINAGGIVAHETSEDFAIISNYSYVISEGELRLGALHSNTTNEEAVKSLSKSHEMVKTLTETLSFTGAWEDKLNPSLPSLGRRFISSNLGYALVKSKTADLYALRLKRNRMLVQLSFAINPDIPEDWNIIMFPLNPTYTKNGTLDGKVGLENDPDYPNADQVRGSYFKPKEAYSLKLKIEREEKNMEAYYLQYNVKSKDKRLKSKKNLEKVISNLASYNWEKRLAKRNLVNTYVWTASGGLFSEENSALDLRSESFGSNFSSVNSTGFSTDFRLSVSPTGKWELRGGAYFQGSFLWGHSLNASMVKSKAESQGFAVKVNVKTDSFLQKWDKNNNGESFDEYAGKPQPGKVNAYRFMTFYLSPTERNGRDFFQTVVKQDWLHTSNDFDARALREALPQKNGVWRVLHRVTYVNRIPPEFMNFPLEEESDYMDVSANPDSNAILIDMVGNRIMQQRQSNLAVGSPPAPTLKASPPTPKEIGEAVAFIMNPNNPITGTLQEKLPWWKDYNTSANSQQIFIMKTNITQYMIRLATDSDFWVSNASYLSAHFTQRSVIEPPPDNSSDDSSDDSSDNSSDNPPDNSSDQSSGVSFTIDKGYISPVSDCKLETRVLAVQFTGTATANYNIDIPKGKNTSSALYGGAPLASCINSRPDTVSLTKDSKLSIDVKFELYNVDTKIKSYDDKRVKILKNGDEVPDIAGYQRQTSLRDVLASYSDQNYQLSISDSQLILCFDYEYKNKKDTIDYQDTVLLLTFTQNS